MSLIRETARTVRNQSRASIQRFRLKHALARLDRLLIARQTPSPDLLARLIPLWGNEAWSTDAPLLSAVLEWLSRTKGPILECGSGLSTLIMASAARAADRTLLSLEHEQSWAERVETHLSPDLRKHAGIAITPLNRYGDFDWYGTEKVAVPKDIGFVLCDGPPGMTRGGRYGLLPQLREKFAPGCIVILDDTQRQDERAIANRWCSEFSARVVQQAETFTVLSIGGN